jgi:Tol biopolymer transport system component
MRADGAGEALRLTHSNNQQEPVSFSPDGKRLAFREVSPQTDAGLWTVLLEGAESDHPKVEKTEPFLQSSFAELWPMISPDGRWLAYLSNESGGLEVYVKPFPGPGGKLRISTGGGSDPLWSKRERQLFYRSVDGIMVASYTVSGEVFLASKPRLWAAKRDLGGFDLAPDGKRVAVMQTEATEQKRAAKVTLLLNFFDELRRRAAARK